MFPYSPPSQQQKEDLSKKYSKRGLGVIMTLVRACPQPGWAGRNAAAAVAAAVSLETAGNVTGL